MSRGSLGFRRVIRYLLNVQQVFIHRRRLISDDRIYPESFQALTHQEKEAMASSA
jgi:hypothetical protein